MIIRANFFGQFLNHRVSEFPVTLIKSFRSSRELYVPSESSDKITSRHREKARNNLQIYALSDFMIEEADVTLLLETPALDHRCLKEFKIFGRELQS